MLLVSFVEIVPFVEYGLYMAAAMQVGFTATLFMHGERDEPIQIVSHGMVRLLHFSNKKVCAGKQPTNRNICKHVVPSQGCCLELFLARHHVVWNIYVENLINIIQCIVFLWGSVFYTLTVFSDFLFHQKSKRCWVCKDAIFFFSPMQPVVFWNLVASPAFPQQPHGGTCGGSSFPLAVVNFMVSVPRLFLFLDVFTLSCFFWRVSTRHVEATCMQDILQCPAKLENYEEQDTQSK